MADRYGQAASRPVHGAFKRYCNDTVGAPGWRRCQDLDSAGFAVKLAHHIWAELPPARKRPFYLRWAAALERGMNATAKVSYYVVLTWLAWCGPYDSPFDSPFDLAGLVWTISHVSVSSPPALYSTHTRARR